MLVGTQVDPADSRDLGKAFLDSAREVLLRAERNLSPVSIRERAILDRLEGPIFALLEKGFSFDEVSRIFQRLSDRPQHSAAAERSALLEQGLRQALRDQEGLHLHYQPQVNMRTGEVLGAEALLRWNFNGTAISPSEFIPIAEDSCLIAPIGEWVLREACREAKRWEAMGLGGTRGIKMSVNLSVKQVSDELPDLVHGLLCDAGLRTHLLGLEITESLLVGSGSVGILHQLRESGVHLSIDDFGTGYSCLAELQDLPVDTIKIDRAFVKGLGTNDHSSVMVEIIIDLAKKLGMTTLAEGVETQEQADALLKLGCTVCQGFFYSRALPGDEFVQFTRSTGHLVGRRLSIVSAGR
jgi:EAL domain-containing protein (putative c-di-GMP-specific phosphodiesterase class I)